MERMMKTLGIDIGTTSVSLSVLDGESGEQIKAVTVGNDSFIETAEPWARLQDAEVIRRKVLEETERILSEYQDVGGDRPYGADARDPVCGSGGKCGQSSVYLAGRQGKSAPGRREIPGGAYL